MAFLFADHFRHLPERGLRGLQQQQPVYTLTPMRISKTQIDRLGDRLRRGSRAEDDLILLDSYRRSFDAAYEEVVRAIRDQLGFEVSGRPAKSTNSIIEKLKRESIRLTQIQDIAGCRLVVSDCKEQELVIRRLVATFPGAVIVDRRKVPSHGYRAVHVVVVTNDQIVELQIRSRLQHMWAEISEKCADIFGLEIKYGGGDEWIRQWLGNLADLIRSYEDLEFDERPQVQESLPEVKQRLLKVLAEFQKILEAG